jgi:hypothetical protein
LINLHNELNIKKNENNEFSFEDYSEEAALKQFKNKIDSQNDSIISKLFLMKLKQYQSVINVKCQVILLTFANIYILILKIKVK